MEAKKLFVVVGIDARQAAAGRVLEQAGYAVGGAEQVALADYILLPLPQSPVRWHWAAGSQFRQRPSHRKLAWSWWITLPDRS